MKRFISLLLVIALLSFVFIRPVQVKAAAATATIAVGIGGKVLELAPYLVAVILLVKACDSTYEYKDDIVDVARDIYDRASSSFRSWAESVGQKISDGADSIGLSKKEIGWISAALTARALTLPGTVNALLIPSLANVDALTATDILSTEATGLLSIANTITSTISTTVSNIYSSIITLPTTIGGYIDTLGTTVSKGLSGVQTWVQNVNANTGQLLIGVQSWLGDVNSTTSNWGRETVNWIKNLNSNTVTQHGILGGIKSAISDGFNSIVEKFNSIFGKDEKPVSPSGSDVVGDLSGVEDSLMQQIQDGLNSGLEYLKNTAPLIKQFAPAFLCVIALFDTFFNIPFFSALLRISLGISVFAIILNIVIDINHYEGVSARRAIAGERYQQRQMRADERMFMSRVRFNNHMEKHMVWRQRQLRGS